MKKRILALACAALMATALSACSKKAEVPASSTTGNSSSTPASSSSSDSGSAPAAPVATTDFPTKNIKIIVPYDAGGGVDITCRLVAEAAGKDFFNGHTLVVENMGGGGAVVGQTYVANAEPDGYTMLAYTSAIVNNPLLKEVTFETADFTPIAMCCFDPEILVVPPNSPYKTIEEFMAYAKENTVKVSTPGHSTSHHLAAIQFAKENDLKFEYLHNDSASVQMQQLMGGHCDAALMAVGETTNQILDGTILGLGVMSEERITDLPDVPTFKEKGMDMVLGAFRGLAVQKDTPPEVVKVLTDTFSEILTSDKFITAMKDASIPYEYRNSTDFKAYVEQQVAATTELLPLLKD